MVVTMAAAAGGPARPARPQLLEGLCALVKGVSVYIAIVSDAAHTLVSIPLSFIYSFLAGPLPRPFPFAKVFDHRQEGDGVAYGIDWRMLQAQGGNAQTFGAAMVVNSMNIAYRVAHANMYVLLLLLLLLLLHIYDTLPCVCVFYF